MLPTEPDHIAAAQAGIEQKREREPRLGPQRVSKLELRDVGLSPGLEATGIPRTLELVADGWVGIDHTPSDCKCHQATQRLEHIALWMWLESLEQFGDVLRLHHGEALVSMFGAKPPKQRASHPLRCRGKPRERLGIHVRRNDGLHGTRVVAVGADQRRCTGERLLICRHELRRPGQAWQRCALVPAAAEIPGVAVVIHERVHVRRQLQARSHSFASLILPGWSGVLAVMITIFPVLSISTRAICTPAAATALTALVTSCCRKADGARAMTATGKARCQTTASRSAHGARSHPGGQASPTGAAYRRAWPQLRSGRPDGPLVRGQIDL